MYIVKLVILVKNINRLKLQKFKMKNNNFSWGHRALIEQITVLLKADKLILGPSDTVLGLFANPTKKGFEALNALKGRQNKPYLLLISAPELASGFADGTNVANMKGVMEKFWPGPLTIVFKAKAGLAPHLISQDGTVALRVPKHEGILRLLENFPALFSTSANKAGQPVPLLMADVHPDLLSEVGYCIRQMPFDPQSPASTIISALEDEHGKTVVSLLRQGSISFEEICVQLPETVLVKRTE